MFCMQTQTAGIMYRFPLSTYKSNFPALEILYRRWHCDSIQTEIETDERIAKMRKSEWRVNHSIWSQSSSARLGRYISRRQPQRCYRFQSVKSCFVSKKVLPPVTSGTRRREKFSQLNVILEMLIMFLFLKSFWNVVAWRNNKQSSLLQRIKWTTLKLYRQQIS